MSYIFTGSTISFQVSSGNFVTVNKDAPKFADIVELVRIGNVEEAYRLSSLRSAVEEAIEATDAFLVGSDLVYRGEKVRGILGKRILDMYAGGFDITHLLRFIDNLRSNPSKRAVDELYGFLESSKLPITEDGYFLAYKSVRSDFTDIHSGTFDNSVGMTCSMSRNTVDENKDRTCSDGLHFAAHEYAAGFGGTNCRMIVVKINPRDVVAIPSDYNNQKGRCCEYLVVEEVHRDDNKLVDTSFYSSGVTEETHSEPEESNFTNEDIWVSYGKTYYFRENVGASDFPVSTTIPYTLERFSNGKKYKNFLFFKYNEQHDNLTFRKEDTEGSDTYQYCTVSDVDDWYISVKKKNVK